MSLSFLDLESWPEGITAARIPANNNTRTLEAFIGPAISASVTSQPVSPAERDIYIIPSGATGGTWSVFDEGDVAIYFDETWTAYAPFDGLRKFVIDEGEDWQYIGGSVGAWATAGGSGGSAVWGSITGTLASQTDLQAALDAKATPGIAQNSQSTAYTLVLSDANKHILHPSADTTPRTFTIPANSSVAYPIGTAVTFVNQNGAGAITIAITSDTMRIAGAGTTGSRTLAANGIASALKITSTEWIISGTGLT